VATARPRTIRDGVQWATAQLDHSDAFFGHGCDNSRDEAIWATLHIAGLMHRDYREIATTTLSEHQFQALRALIDQRIESRKPLAYLIREAWFAGYTFHIDERAIVPRSHFGDLIQDGFEPWIQPLKLKNALDLCCGSACIAVALALTHPHLTVDASDIDPQALEVASINIARHQVGARVRILQSNLFGNLSQRRYDLILCNPPYIAQSDLPQLPKEYGYEPRQAFAAGTDGLYFVRQILQQASSHLSNQGFLLLELGHSANALEAAYPDIPFLWLTSRGGESVVLLLSRQELDQYRFASNC